MNQAGRCQRLTRQVIQQLVINAWAAGALVEVSSRFGHEVDPVSPG